MSFRESPRIRRLRSDLRSLQRLRDESTIFDFAAAGHPPERYDLTFHGTGLRLSADMTRVELQMVHRIEIRLGANYPRLMPELSWRTPIFHPNISAIGMVCLGGYGQFWVPSLQLDELVSMLWDMVRFENFDVTSPYNRSAADWTRGQTQFVFPLDPRGLRDKVQRPLGGGPGQPLPAGAPGLDTSYMVPGGLVPVQPIPFGAPVGAAPGAVPAVAPMPGMLPPPPVPGFPAGFVPPPRPVMMPTGMPMPAAIPVPPTMTAPPPPAPGLPPGYGTAFPAMLTSAGPSTPSHGGYTTHGGYASPAGFASATGFAQPPGLAPQPGPADARTHPGDDVVFLDEVPPDRRGDAPRRPPDEDILFIE